MPLKHLEIVIEHYRQINALLLEQLRAKDQQIANYEQIVYKLIERLPDAEPEADETQSDQNSG